MYTIQEIKEITHARLINGKEEVEITNFNVSNKNHKKDDFYIPILWREDRQKYIMDAVNAEAIGYMISNQYEFKEEIIQESIEINPNITILEVEDINEAIYTIAMDSREKNIDIPIIAVTGSVGKTSTCKMITTIIEQEKRVLSDTQNNNTKPLLSWLMLDIQDYKMAVLEAGIGNKNVMEPISKLLIPSIAVINNIGTAHIEKLGSKEDILKEKLQLTKYMRDNKIVLLNNDDTMLQKLELGNEYKVIRYSIKEAKEIQQKDETLAFITDVYGKDTKIILNTYGEHNVLNAICAIRIGEILNVKKSNIIKGIKEYRNIERRFNVIKQNGYAIIDDTYNASLASMQAGLTSADKIEGYKRKIAVLGEMLELGEYSKTLHEQVGEIFKEVNFDILITNGENTKYICESAKKYMKDKTLVNFEKQEEAIEYLLNTIKQHDLIYLKASKKMNFDKIVQRLLEKV